MEWPGWRAGPPGGRRSARLWWVRLARPGTRRDGFRGQGYL